MSVTDLEDMGFLYGILLIYLLETFSSLFFPDCLCTTIPELVLEWAAKETLRPIIARRSSCHYECFYTIALGVWYVKA